MKQTLSDALNWRYATKVFDSEKKISDENLSSLQESLVLTPSSFGLQPWKFIIITNAELREKLLPHSWNQTQVTDCSHFLVMCHRRKVTTAQIDTFLQSITDARGTSTEDLAGYRQMMIGFTENMSEAEMNAWAQRQAYIALGQLMTAAALLKIDACPMEGFSAAEYDKILDLEGTEFTSSVCCALGYRHEDDKYATVAKVRFAAEEIISEIS